VKAPITAPGGDGADAGEDPVAIFAVTTVTDLVMRPESQDR
jgi:hypothetical protein